MDIVISLGALYYVLNYCHAITTYKTNIIMYTIWTLDV